MSIRVTFSPVRSNTRLGALIPDVADALHAYTSNWSEDIAKDMREYPSPPANSKYERTFKLQRAWKVEERSTGFGIRYIVSNSAQDPYDRYYARGVQSRPSQWSVHSGRWQTIQDVIEKRGGRDRFRRETQLIITRLMKRR